MPTIMTHAAVTWMLGKGLRWRRPARVAVISALCGVIPDLDAIGHQLGVPYLHHWGHRGLSHSLAFAFAFGVALSLCCVPPLSVGRSLQLWWRRLGWSLYFGLLMSTHGLLDMLTTGGHGVALFAPYQHDRLFFPRLYRVVKVSPMGRSALSWERLEPVLLSELYWIISPCLAVLMALALLHWIRARSAEVS